MRRGRASRRRVEAQGLVLREAADWTRGCDLVRSTGLPLYRLGPALRCLWSLGLLETRRSGFLGQLRYRTVTDLREDEPRDDGRLRPVSVRPVGSEVEVW